MYPPIPEPTQKVVRCVPVQQSAKGGRLVADRLAPALRGEYG
jgi:hypothetical protein